MNKIILHRSGYSISKKGHLRSQIRANRLRAIAIILAVALLPVRISTGQEQKLTQYVNPFIGTAPNPFIKQGLGGAPGSVFPGTVCPDGMLAFSPDTPLSYAVAGGYAYQDSTIIDFSLTHFSGRGVVYLRDFCFMPVLQQVNISPVGRWNSFAASFSHANETANPGYYSVKFDNGMVTELTATARTGMARFTYPENNQASTLLIKADGLITVNGNEVTGYRNAVIGGKARTYRIYFVAKFDHPIKSVKTWTENEISDRTSVQNDSCGAILSFDTSKDRTIQMKAAISYVSIENAKLNLKKENAGWNFNAIRIKADAAWNKVLNLIQVTGGEESELQTFYTALYHCYMHPNLLEDVNGEYVGMDLKVHKAPKGHHQYHNIPAWDQHRSHTQLVTMLSPDKMSDVNQSLINYAEQDLSLRPNGGGFPRWQQVYRNSAGMVGDGDCQLIASAYAFGAKNFDTKSALSIMHRGATQPGITSDGFSVRGGLKEYMSVGHLPMDISKTLEYCNDDFAIAQFALSLGDKEKHDFYRNRAQNWKTIFDNSIGYIRPKDSAGVWYKDFTPSNKTGCTEGTAAQYFWMVNFNYRTLIDSIGGNDKAVKRLDGFFTKLASGARGETAHMGNEICEETPWVYDFASAPWGTQDVVRRIRKELFTNKPNGLPGNDDAGALSSWYVFSALGFYPEIPGVDVLVLGSPLFKKAVLHLKKGDVIITGNGNGAEAPYVQSFKLNGKEWAKPWIRFSDISNGGKMAFELNSTPNKNWGSNPNDAPPSYDIVQ